VRNQNKRALAKLLKPAFLEEKPLGGVAFWVQLLWFRYRGLESDQKSAGTQVG